MRKVLKNSTKTKEYLEKLPKIYLVACWASYGIMEYPFSGKYIKENGKDIPLVYDHDDCNGTCDCWWLRKITNTTTGGILTWTQNKAAAKTIANAMNVYRKFKLLHK